ncbi:MAG TPA: hypothetical protein VFW65_38040 [Pseudonocardiaceae bacterium]|nr:hypothetical protein [Pseudonocardiaceae bacterium]
MGTGRLRLGLCFVGLTTALATVACGPGSTTASPPVPVITNLPTTSTSEVSPFLPPDTTTETVVVPSTTTTVPPTPHPSTPRRTVVAPHPSTHPRTVVPQPPTPVDGPVPAAQIDASGATADPPRDVRTERGGTAVVFTVEESGCDQIHPDVTGQSSSRVLIMLVRSEPTKHAICPMFARNALLTASLSAPLGQRTVVFEAITESP